MIHGLEYIAADGRKWREFGSNPVGRFFEIPGDNILIICEGFATGASVYEATGHSVFVAFGAGNLLAVAQQLRTKCPRGTIIMAADNDSSLANNPGLTKAQEAAKAVKGFVALPDFSGIHSEQCSDFNDLARVGGPQAVKTCINEAVPWVDNEDQNDDYSIFPENRGPQDTDFNDLARLSGFNQVKECVEGATSITEKIPSNKPGNFEAIIQRLAALSPLEYDQERKTQAKQLGVRAGTLDVIVKAARVGGPKEVPFVEVEPCPEPIDPAVLLTAIVAAIGRFIVCDPGIAVAAALWCAMTWFVDNIQVAPLAIITAPEKRCVKSLLLSILGRLVRLSVTASNISLSALFRSIEKWQPTLLIDEADTFMRDNDDLKGILNSGHTRDSAFVIRSEGDDHAPTKFSTWGCKAISGIGYFPETLMDRGIILNLRRKLPSERVERIRHADPTLFSDLQEQLARFAEDYAKEVRNARPPLPDSLNDRAQDNWEPLLQIASIAGDEWLQLGTQTAIKLSGNDNLPQSIGTELLSDVMEIFEQKNIGRISTSSLIEALCEDDEKPWATYNKGENITPRQLANKLKGYGIKSTTAIRTGDGVTRGYKKEQFVDAFARYATLTPLQSVTVLQSTTDKDLRGFSKCYMGVDVTDKNQRKSTTSKDCNTVTHRSPPESGAHVFWGEEDDLREVLI